MNVDRDREQDGMRAVHVAFTIAVRAHKGQTDKAGRAYIVHPAAVCEQVTREHPDDWTSRAAAWLHDVLEDTPTTVADLRAAGIPDSVIGAVVALTKVKGEPLAAYYERVKADPAALRVKLADIADNRGPARGGTARTLPRIACIV